MTFRALPIVLALALTTALEGQQTTLLVLSKRAHTLSVVDPITFKVRASMPIGDDPHEVEASADGTRAYVSNYGFGSLHTITEVDLTTNKTIGPIDIAPLGGPHGMTFVDGKLWFTAEGSKVIGHLDPATRKVDWVMGTGLNRTHMLVVEPGGEHIITSNVSSGAIAFLDYGVLPPQAPPPPPPGAAPHPMGAQPRRSDWNETVVKVGPGSEGFDESPDHTEVWVANAGDGTISILDRNARAVKETLQAHVSSANRLKFTPDGKLVLVTLLNGPDLMIFDAHTHQLVHRVTIGTGAAGLLLAKDGSRAYASCTPDGWVAVVDMKTFQVVGKIDAGGGPDGLAWATKK